MLLFVPFGIFYPFFLFYKKLLNVDTNYDNLVDQPIQLSETSELISKLPITSLNPETIKLEELNNIQATVSKLQIAFAVENVDIRHKLAELCSSVDPRTDRGVAELMRKTISLFISQDEWTHISCSSESLPINRVKGEFELISATEKSKFGREELSLVDTEERSPKPNNSLPTDMPKYVVVTLILCTSHTEPLFWEIRTKRQLVEELSELGKMRQDDLIKFDLLWNPQAEAKYLSNNELLKKYIDMIRLF
nr:DUF1517 domain-containing protein [Waterburya agarophytonicola]